MSDKPKRKRELVDLRNPTIRQIASMMHTLGMEVRFGAVPIGHVDPLPVKPRPNRWVAGTRRRWSA